MGKHSCRRTTFCLRPGRHTDRHLPASPRSCPAAASGLRDGSCAASSSSPRTRTALTERRRDSDRTIICYLYLLFGNPFLIFSSSFCWESKHSSHSVTHRGLSSSSHKWENPEILNYFSLAIDVVEPEIILSSRLWLEYV